MIKFKNCFPDLLDEADIKAHFLERYEDAFDDGAEIHDYYFEESDSAFGHWGRITTAMIEWEDETYYAIRRRGCGYLGKHRNVILSSDRILFGNQARAHNSLYKSWDDFSMIFTFWMREFENDAAWKEAVEARIRGDRKHPSTKSWENSFHQIRSVRPLTSSRISLPSTAAENFVYRTGDRLNYSQPEFVKQFEQNSDWYDVNAEE